MSHIANARSAINSRLLELFIQRQDATTKLDKLDDEIKTLRTVANGMDVAIRAQINDAREAKTLTDATPADTGKPN